MEKYRTYTYNENGHSQIYVEGAGAACYQSYTHIFTWSTGCKKPDVQIMTYSEALKLVANCNCQYKKTIMISDSDDESSFQTYCMYERYDMQKKKRGDYK